MKKGYNILFHGTRVYLRNKEKIIKELSVAEKNEIYRGVLHSLWIYADKIKISKASKLSSGFTVSFNDCFEDVELEFSNNQSKLRATLAISIEKKWGKEEEE